MGYLKAKDTVNGALGTCFAIIDGKRYELMQVKNVTASVKKMKTEIPILGMTGKQHKSGGWEGSGKMTAYYVSSLFRELMMKYMKNGVDTYFELMITHEDPTGATGKQTVLLKDVIAVVTIHDDAVPDDQRIDNHTICQDVFLQLFQFLLTKRRNLARKLRVNGEMLQHRFLPFDGWCLGEPQQVGRNSRNHSGSDSKYRHLWSADEHPPDAEMLSWRPETSADKPGTES